MRVFFAHMFRLSSIDPTDQVMMEGILRRRLIVKRGGSVGFKRLLYSDIQHVRSISK